jgi:hypothetical protein
MDRGKKVDRRRKVVYDVDCFDVLDDEKNNMLPKDDVNRNTTWGSFMNLNDTVTADMEIMRQFCTKKSTSVEAPYSTYTIEGTDRTYGIKTIKKKRDDQERKLVINSLDTLLKRKYIDRVSALDKYFIHVYDVFEVAWRDGFLTYVILECMTGDGSAFRRKYSAGKAQYELLLHQMSISLLTGLQRGLFRNNLYFSDIKPPNFAYSVDEDGSFKFKWIDVDCISNVSTGICSSTGYIDPYNQPVDTDPGLNDTRLFHSDLFKFGLSLYEMVTGSHPLLPNPMISVSPKNRQTVIEMHRKVFAHNNPEVLPSLQHLIISLLHPDGNHRVEFCTEFTNNDGVLSEERMKALDDYKITSKVDMDNIEKWQEQGKSMFDPPPPSESDNDEEELE